MAHLLLSLFLLSRHNLSLPFLVCLPSHHILALTFLQCLSTYHS